MTSDGGTLAAATCIFPRRAPALAVRSGDGGALISIIVLLK